MVDWFDRMNSVHILSSLIQRLYTAASAAAAALLLRCIDQTPSYHLFVNGRLFLLLLSCKQYDANSFMKL